MTFEREHTIILRMKSRNQHVLLHEGKWAVKGEGRKCVTAVYETKQEAIDAAREIAKNSGTEILVHGLLGQIFQRSEIPSTLNEDAVRQAIRALAQEPVVTKNPKRRSTTKKMLKQSPQ